MTMIGSESLKKILGEFPVTADLYWRIMQQADPPVGGYLLDDVRKHLPTWLDQARAAEVKSNHPKRVLVFSVLRYWLEHSLLMSLALVAFGHEVTLAYLPYAHWKRPINRFDLRRQDLYIKSIIKQIEPFVRLVSMLDAPKADRLPEAISDQMAAAAFRDTQYSMLREDIDTDGEIYRLRQERNNDYALRMLAWMQNERPDVVVVPNGSILEFGITYRLARYLNIPVTTYEFGEQNHRMWMAQNNDVMRQDTSDLWNARGEIPLTDVEKELIYNLFSSRQGASLWHTFARRWQDAPKIGGSAIRQELGLDLRPLALIPANVLGDSLVLGRQLFSESNTEWLKRTVEFFIEHPEAQLVIRVHPGERIGWGSSVYEILVQHFQEFPENIHLLPAESSVNTYDLVDAADFGLVFTTTTGMEMAMIGKPVIVTGHTHYRGKGFTIDPNTWKEYFEALKQVLYDPKAHTLSEGQIELSWRYAYRFFFEYPQPFPWRVPYLWESLKEWSMARVLSPEGQAQFGNTFRYLVGEPIDWARSYVEGRLTNE
ncbi:MAG: hypothetical protein FJ010_01885 [Chloroflexi bacterium]|nr:hypothetical protein [Chloroflexota bacterium]